MVARIGAWVELNFWQMAVRVLSGARPIQRVLSHAADNLEDQPLTAFMPNGWVIALSGWLAGLIVGLALSIWWLG